MMEIRQQDEAYKRGLVLGLTMAEIIILVLFCLLMALGTIFADQNTKIEDQDQRIKIQDERISELKSATVVDPEDLRIVKTLKEYWKQHAPNEERFRPYFSDLVLRVQELDRLRAEMEELVEKHRELADESKQFGKTNQHLEEQLTQAREAAAEREALEAELTKTEEELSRVSDELMEARRAVEAVEAEAGQRDGHTWPPIIRLKEAEGFRFAVGDARLSDQFKEQLKNEVIPKILTYITQYDVDVIEIVGHTDEQPVIGRQSNLDAELLAFLRDGEQALLRAADNAGLGLARAATVARFLRQDDRLAEYTILPLSSAQVMDVTGELADGTNRGDVPDRRRIEIRLRRSDSG